MHRNALRLSLFALPVLLAACANTPQQRTSTPEPVAAASVPLQQAPSPQARPVASQPFRTDAPHQYTVKRGDTLWDLAQRFLNDPWVWPEIWYDNPQVRNPHLIFPGDQLVIAMIDGKQRLTKKLTPHVRISPLDKALPTLPLEAIQPFLSYPQVLEVAELNDAPQIIGSPDGRLVLGRHDTVYTYGGHLNRDALRAVVRPHKPLIDPLTEEVLGYEVDAVGKAVVLRNDEPATLKLTESQREARKGDRLVGLPKVLGQDLKLTALPASVNGLVISLPDTTTRSSQWQIVALNKGRSDGIQAGHVIRLHQPGAITKVDTSLIPDPTGKSSNKGPSTFDNPIREVQLPDVTLGDAVVFLVYDRVSYALITEVDRPVRVGDCFSAPEKHCG
ncbi:MAG: LysM peptidoglycan-binding domain-containing protein [Pseudomonadota bacterium]